MSNIEYANDLLQQIDSAKNVGLKLDVAEGKFVVTEKSTGTKFRLSTIEEVSGFVKCYTFYYAKINV